MQKHSEQREIETDDACTMDEIENEFEEPEFQIIRGCTGSIVITGFITFLIIKIIQQFYL